MLERVAGQRDKAFADIEKAEAEIAELKGKQVPVGIFVGPDEYSDVIHISWMNGVDTLPKGTKLFTAPQKPVVKLFTPLNPVMFNADVMFGYNKARAEDTAAIEAAGGVVKDGE